MYTDLEIALMEMMPRDLDPDLALVWYILEEEDTTGTHSRFDEMVRSMRVHAMNAGAVNIISADNARQLKIGWTDTNSERHWEMRLTDIQRRRGLGSSEAVSRSICTNEGRQALAEALTKVSNFKPPFFKKEVNGKSVVSTP